MHLCCVEITVTPFRLEFRHPFKIAAGERTHTDTVYVELSQNGITGYGEAALPPYLPDKTSDVINALQSLDIPDEYRKEDFHPLLQQWTDCCRCMPALAAADIALHDLQGKLTGMTVRSLYKAEGTLPDTAFTIGISHPDELISKLQEAADFNFFKLKLNGNRDEETILAFREATDKPFCVDVNRGWRDMQAAMSVCKILDDAGCLFLEQPFEKNMPEETGKLMREVSMPVILDESVQTFDDIDNVKAYCSGINIKLVKCGGIYNAYRMIKKARENGMKVFLGCMSESSCGTAAMAQLASLADWIDLDGPLLISNDPFTGLNYRQGKMVLSAQAGNGITRVG